MAKRYHKSRNSRMYRDNGMYNGSGVYEGSDMYRQSSNGRVYNDDGVYRDYSMYSGNAVYNDYGSYRGDGNRLGRGNVSFRHNPDKFNDEERHDQDPRNGSMGFRVLSEPYAGMDARRHIEMQDAGMIREDNRAIANLPQNVMIRAYPRTGPYLPEGLNDDIRGVDMQMDYDDYKRREHFYPKKV